MNDSTDLSASALNSTSLQDPVPNSLDAPQKNVQETASFFIELPTLSQTDSDLYQPWNKKYETDDDDGDSGIVVELIGEYTSGNKRYIYARHRDGVVRRKEYWEFEQNYPRLYNTYERKRKSGQFKSFDPSASYVRPKDRVSLVINIDLNKATRNNFRDDSYGPSHSDTGSSDMDGLSDEDDDEDYEGRVMTRAYRLKASTQKRRSTRKLPFSPKRLRRTTRHRHPSHSSDFGDDSESNETSDSKKHRQRTGSDQGVTSNDSDQSEGLSTKNRMNNFNGKLIKSKKSKAIKPAYGLIRNVDNLYDSDSESTPLRAHRDFCERCHRKPAHRLKANYKKRRKRKTDDIFSDDDDSYENLGGWIRCLKCCVCAHWRCLAASQRSEILSAARVKPENHQKLLSNSISGLEWDETTDFICGSCSKGGVCMVCKQSAIEEESKPTTTETMPAEKAEDVLDTLEEIKSALEPVTKHLDQEKFNELLFRCVTCKRFAHYSHLAVKGEDYSSLQVAKYYQENNAWQCAECVSYVFPVDKILAWRPYPADASDAYTNSNEIPEYKTNLQREYLVKWIGRSYRRTQWVSHLWLLSTHQQKLRNFYRVGSGVELTRTISEEDSRETSMDIGLFTADNSRQTSVDIETTTILNPVPPPALVDADRRIPLLWTTVDCILDILLWNPRKLSRQKSKSQRKKAAIVESNSSDSDVTASPSAQANFDAAFDNGEEPSQDYTESVYEFENRLGRKLEVSDVKNVVWAFIKWGDLPYDEATWDSPPKPGAPGYSAFQHAFKVFLDSREVVVAKKSRKDIELFESRFGKRTWNSAFLGISEEGYDMGQDKSLTLLPFQVTGVNWLCRNWFHHQQSILADEMGLGKTVQIITFLGILHEKMQAFPSLVVVPNSTITNWIREFNRWAPRLRAVPFYGDQKSRDIIQQYELYHDHVAPGTTGLKYHVLVTTYETLTGPKNFSTVFKPVPRWEVLVVDEGQRLKNDTNVIFKRLNELKSYHRIIMTGTPLNNNIRELFSLMNFLNPDDWNDLDRLSKQFEELNEDLVKELRDRLRPYFLRRVKADVLDLPPKNEVIVPLSMATLQKEMYKSILSNNVALLQHLTNAASSRINKSVANRANLKNMLMQLRKCLQHPYLIADDIEPKGLSPTEAHLKLIDASSKLRFLKLLLPKLKARGHRVLLFSQFVIALDIIEDFLNGEGYKFLRLDGNTKQSLRQKGMDEFNRPNSDVFIYILSTRAGGVGINLWSADTVIIFDPDFNPHQDLQAIARAHRYGQTKTCLVFKFMIKDSAEEKIFQTGKKKMVLDHLIVQKMDDEEDTGTIQSILMFGAKALFDETGDQGNRDIVYTENDVEKLIEKVETESEEQENTEATNSIISFAKVWSSHKDTLDEIPEETEHFDQDSWAQTLRNIASEQKRAVVQEKVGRGAKRKATHANKYYLEETSPAKILKDRNISRSSISDDEYHVITEVEEETDSASQMDVESLIHVESTIEAGKLQGIKHVSNVGTIDASPFIASHKPAEDRIGHYPIPDSGDDPSLIAEECGLCGQIHGPSSCPMTANPTHLVKYRMMIIEDYMHERLQIRERAVRAIDKELARRGLLSLIANQPKECVKKQRGPRVAEKRSIPFEPQNSTAKKSKY